MQTPSADDGRTAYERETAHFREVLARGRSANQLVLFDLLVERSRDQRSPKELEIALAMFGNEATRDGSPESGVRVYVHRLRKRIDEHYRNQPGPRLTIPKGEYRIVLEDSPVATLVTPFARLQRLWRGNPALVFGLLILAGGALALATWNLLSSSGITTAGAAHRQAILGRENQPFQPLIVVGDSLMLAETRDQRSIKRLRLDPAIRNRDDFGRYLKAHPDAFYRLYDFNLNFAPVRAVEAAWSVQTALYPLDAPTAAPGHLVPLAKLPPEELDTKDIVYVGRLAQLGTLQSRVFAGSRFRLAAYNRLEDRTSGTRFEGQVYQDPQGPAGKDYGYFSIRESPQGRLMVVVAGLGDQGTASIAALLGSAQELTQLRRAIGARRDFEALFEVSGAPDQGAGQRRLVAFARL